MEKYKSMIVKMVNRIDHINQIAGYESYEIINTTDCIRYIENTIRDSNNTMRLYYVVSLIELYNSYTFMTINVRDCCINNCLSKFNELSDKLYFLDDFSSYTIE